MPRGHYEITTVTAALEASGSFAIDLADGATNGTRSRAYVADVLVPALQSGDTVVVDNLSAHKVTGISQNIETAGGRLLHPPAYSFDLNCIENLLARLKPLLRMAAARSVPDLHAAIRHAFTRLP